MTILYRMVILFMGEMNMKIQNENIVTVLRTKFLSLLDLQYEPKKHYFSATRRAANDIVAIKSDEEFKNMCPDAVSCIVILEIPGEEPKILLSYEYRYPINRFLLSVPAGLVDEKEKTNPDSVVLTAIREIWEETGLTVKDTDSITVINPLVFSSPGMTDESNALVCIVLHPDNLSELSQKGADGTELFNGFELLTQSEAIEVIQNGRDKNGNFYPVYTWAALVYFVSGAWKTDFDSQTDGLKSYTVSFHASCMTGTEKYRVVAKDLDAAKQFWENYVQNSRLAYLWEQAVKGMKNHYGGYVHWKETEQRGIRQGVFKLSYDAWNTGSDHLRD